MMKILYARTADFDRDLLAAVSDRETRTRAADSIQPEKGDEILLGRYLARKMAARMSGQEPRDVRLRHDATGRPAFQNLPYFVSISHSDGMAAALVHTEKAVLDLKGIRRFGGEAIRGFFSPAEYEQIIASNHPDREMTRIFCRRECMVKWMGRRPKQAGWDAETERALTAPEAFFTETEIDGRLICVLAGDRDLILEHVKQLKGAWE